MNSFSQLNLQIPDLWEVKDVINKVKNVVLNYTEMEAKVHEATSNEAWGASTTLMQEIAQGTYNYQYFNEIMPTLYKRFSEKEAKQWRQIYKALVLLEYLIKNGSERVIDDARSHISMIKMMRHFHYIDEKGKDQGVNIRNRAKELAELINDTEKIRIERKKARQNRNKYTGVGSESSFGMGGGARSRYSGFGSETLGTASIRADSSFGSGATSSYYDEEDRRGRHRGSKYDDFDDLPPAQPERDPSPKNNAQRTKAKTAKDLNLFDLDSETPSASISSAKVVDDDWGDFTAGGVASGQGALDDFDDFQSAPPSSGTRAAAAAAAAASGGKGSSAAANDLFDLLSGDDFVTPVQTVPPVIPSQTSVASGSNTSSAIASPVIPSQPKTADANKSPETTKKSDLPSGMWSQASAFVSLDSLGKPSGPAKPATGPSINSLKTSSVNAGWSAWASSNQAQPKPPQRNSNVSFDSLLL